MLGIKNLFAVRKLKIIQMLQNSQKGVENIPLTRQVGKWVVICTAVSTVILGMMAALSCLVLHYPAALFRVLFLTFLAAGFLVSAVFFFLAGRKKRDGSGPLMALTIFGAAEGIALLVLSPLFDSLVRQRIAIQALFLILQDEDVNKFLPWYPVKDMDETKRFYEERYASKYARPQAYAYAICLKEDNYPIGYIKVDMEEHHDFGYGLRKEFWHKGIVTEAGRAVIEQVKKDGLPYITATHDRNNPRSGGVMRNAGMEYQYSYEEQWKPKNVLVTFRLYQLNLDGNESRVYKKYWDTSAVHFIEPDL